MKNCNITIEANGQLNGNGSIEISYSSSDKPNSNKVSVVNVIYMISESNASVSFNKISGSLENTASGKSNTLNIRVSNNGRYDLTNLKFNVATDGTNTGAVTATSNSSSDDGCNIYETNIFATGSSCVLQITYKAPAKNGISNDENGEVVLTVVGNYKNQNNNAMGYISSVSAPYSTNFLPKVTVVKSNHKINELPNYIVNYTTTGGRSGSASWIDEDGNLWVFGGLSGFIYPGTNSSGGISQILADLWKYDVKHNVWTLMDGYQSNSLSTGHFGDYSEPNDIALSGLTYPASTTDKDGNFWLFDGANNARLNLSYTATLSAKLLKFNHENNVWILEKDGSNHSANTNFNYGVYGDRGIAASTNSPGSRSAASMEVDINGNLWLFGGSGYADKGDPQYLNDLWKYDVKAKMWTWMKGNTSAHYGVKGTASTRNEPLARSNQASWVDKDGNFWLFGGFGCLTSTNCGLLNDLWKYDVESNMWTWMSGESTFGSTSGSTSGKYGEIGIFAKDNLPSARYSNCSWVDKNGNFWMFGGSLVDTYINDLWKYDVNNNMWALMEKKSDATISTISSKISARVGLVCRINKEGKVMIFGGFGFGTLGEGLAVGALEDLWQIN